MKEVPSVNKASSALGVGCLICPLWLSLFEILFPHTYVPFSILLAGGRYWA
jgi:hypothetical protein